MEFVKFSEYGKGTLSSLLKDAYSSDKKITEVHKKDWKIFDAFVYDNLKFMDNCGFISLEDFKPIGFMSWDPRGLPDHVEIGHNCIARDFKRRGLGKEQLAHGVRLIKLLKPAKIIVRTGNVPFFIPARSMYESEGFVPGQIIKQVNEIVPEIIEYRMIL
jgi:ribosomal protein S18 acetylase RimI-like enzyme